MTPQDDYGDGMGTPLFDDEAIEAFFLGTGQSVWAQDDALAMLAEEVLVATGGPPPRPHGALLAFLEDTAPALAAVPTLAPAAASPWHSQPTTAPATPTYRTNLRLLISRRLRLTAGIAAGIGIAAAALTVAGTTGFLPDPAMRAIVRVVEAVTPFEVSEPGKPPAATVPAPQPGTTSVPATPGAGSVAVGQSGPPEQAPAITPPLGPPGSLPPTVQQPGSTGIDRARETPAGPFIPPFVPGGSAGPPPTPSGDGSGPPSPGVDRARETPAGTFIPPFVGGPPGRR
jgi:hypothetical protein